MNRNTIPTDSSVKYAGIDYHKKFSVVTLGDATAKVIMQEKLLNDPNAIKTFFKNYGSVICAIENCRGMEWFVELLQELGLTVHISNTYAVKLISQSRCKTDKIDSRILMELLAKGFLPTCYQPTRGERLLRERLRWRTMLVRSRTQYKNSAHAHLDKENKGAMLDSKKRRTSVSKSSGVSTERQELLDLKIDVVEHFEELIAGQDKWIVEAAANNPDAQLLTSVPGIGNISALVFLAEIGDIKRFKRASKVSSYLGLVPRLYSSSDTHRTGAITKQGSGYVRWILVQDAWVAIRQNDILKYRFAKICKKKGKKVAIVAIARMLAEIAYRVIRDQRKFDESLLTLG